MAQRGENKDRIGLVPALMLALVFVICYLSAIAALTPKRYDVAVDAEAAQTITAPRTIEDEAATEALRDAARNDTKTVYKLDQILVEQYTGGAEQLFNDIDAFRMEAEQIRVARIAGSGLKADGSLSVEEWQKILTEQELQQILARFTVGLSAGEGWWLLHVEESELQRLQDTVLPKLKVALQNGLEERALSARKTAFVQELNATSLSDTLKSVGQKAFDAFLMPTFVPDAEATNQAREEAAAAVKSVEVKRGDVIVRQGEAVTQQQFELLSKLDLVRSHRTDAMLDIGAALYLICLFAVFAAYLILYRRRMVANRKHMLILSVMLALTVLLAFGLQALDGRITPSLIGVMLIALLVDGHIAMAANVLLAFFIGWMAGGQGSGMLGFDSVVMTTSMLAGGQVAVYLLRGCQKRGTIITAGLFSGLVAALVILAAYVMAGRSVGNILISAAWAVGSSVLSAVLVVGSLSLWENAFDVATSARLSELSNANHPLLRQLMTEAPGTYHHSMMTAALSESAAEAVEADPLLARVGAYYHDVGKLRRPLYFKENQKPGENIHDTLPPAESAAIILAHQKDGVILLNKHRMPSAVVQIAFEHHGTTMAAYFYQKAVRENGGRQISQKNFRYPGARPSTKESAIVLLADSCEAAVRSIDSPSRETVEETVEKIIKGKMDDGQLSAAPLTLRELYFIQQSFLRTFNGLLHERIAYPELNTAEAQRD